MTTSNASTATLSGLGLTGDWTSNIDALTEKFASAEPYPHVVIENMFKEEVAMELFEKFLNPYENRKGWVVYNNPIERKFAHNDVPSFPDVHKRVFDFLQSDEAVSLFSRITGIPNLEADPHLHGAGMHFHPKNGKLDMHLDYSIHPKSGKERRLNLIMYLNPKWEDWGGGLELWGHDEQNRIKDCVVKIPPLFNTAVLFRTTDISYHGLPDPLTCPEGMARRSMAVYYVSEPREDVAHRLKARFVARPSDPQHAGMDKLREIRVTRVLTPADIEEHVPGWDEAMPW